MNDCYLNFLVSFRALFSLDVGANLVNSKQTIGIILPDLSLLGYAVPVESFGIGLFVILFTYLIIEYNVQLLSHEKFKIAMNMLHTAHTPLILLRNQLEELKTGNLPEPLSQQVEEALGYAAYSVVLIFFLHENPVRMKIEKVVANGISKGNSIGKGLLLLFSNISFWVILFYFAAPSLPGWATKNWLPTLFAENLDIPMSQAGPISTITIALSSFVGVILGGFLSDRWVLKNIRGRVYTGAIGLGMTIPALLLIGFGHGFISVIGAGLLFGIGFGIFDANNMPILCQFVSAKYRGTAYGIMNMTGVFAGAAVTQLLGKWTDGGSLGEGFAMLSIVVALALGLQLYFLRPKTDNME